MRPVPLTDPTGAVCAWRCGRCGQAYTAEMFAPDPDVAAYLAWQAEHSKPNAESCCRCSGCGTELPHDEQSGECEACARGTLLRRAEWLDENERQELARDEILRLHALDIDAARQLETVMSDLSEDAYCSSWEQGLEFTLWQYVLDGPDPEPAERGWGFASAVREPDVAELRRLSENAGGWWVWDEKMGGHLFVPMAEWRERYAARAGNS